MSDENPTELHDAWEILDYNIDRVEGLIGLCNSIVENENSNNGTPKSGRNSQLQEDILRGALVLIHASMEDFLRTLLKWKYSNDDCEAIIEHLVKKSVIGSSLNGKTSNCCVVKRYLREFYSVGGKKKIVKSLSSIRIPKAISKAKIRCNDQDDLAEMMNRRHKIVHSADRNFCAGKGKHDVNEITIESIDNYIEEVRELSKFVAEHVKEYET